MYDYPIEQEEPTSTCVVCGAPVADGENFCSLECMRAYAELSLADIRRMEAILVPPIENQTLSPEGVELDIAMERRKENLNNRDWAARQARLLRISFRG